MVGDNIETYDGNKVVRCETFCHARRLKPSESIGDGPQSALCDGQEVGAALGAWSCWHFLKGKKGNKQQFVKLAAASIMSPISSEKCRKRKVRGWDASLLCVLFVSVFQRLKIKPSDSWRCGHGRLVSEDSKMIVLSSLWLSSPRLLRGLLDPEGEGILFLRNVGT